MDTEHQIENAKLISAFLDDGTRHPTCHGAYPFGIFCRWEYMKYHSSWDWLMLVVDKIEEHGHPVQICQKDCNIFRQYSLRPSEVLSSITSTTKHAAAYVAVLKFINWYNSQPL